MRKVLKAVGYVLLGLLAAVAVYAIYLLVTYKRLPDNMELSIEPPLAANENRELHPGETYRAITYNIGFGAYTPDFSFFMDGGTQSWAKSKDSVLETVSGAVALVDSFAPDFVLLQEVDRDATRSYHVNQYELISKELATFYSAYAINYDSAFLAYPFHQPHGSSEAGLVLYSEYPITSSLRRSLPISTSLTKFVDLDRCYSVSRIPVDNGKELVIINLHTSAYGNSDAIRQGQIAMLCEDMEREYAAGNYVICGGDFNHDLKNLSDNTGESASWAYPFPRESLPEHFSFCIDSFQETEREAMWNTARNADMEYEEGVTFTVTLDGFVISDNIQCTNYMHVNTGYAYSDHDPVYMEFVLRP